MKRPATALAHSLKPITAVILTSLAGTSQGAGFALIEQGVSGLGNAFAGNSASAEDASTIYFNPAGLTRLSGTQYNVGAHVIAPSAKFRDRGSSINPALGGSTLFGGTGGDGGERGVAPNFYYARDLTGDIRFGLGVNAPFGLATKYNDGWRGRYHAIKSELITVNINPAIAFKATDQLSLGFGVSAQYIEVELTNALDIGTVCAANVDATTCGNAGLAPLQSDGQQKLEGDDWGFGFNLGLLYEFNDNTRVGFAYRSKVEQELEGDVDFTTPAALAAFAPLAANFQDTGIKADADLPETYSVSGFHQPSDKWAFLADVTYTKWDRFKELRIRFDNGNPDSVTPENWDNTWRYSVGANYYAHPDWTLRGGLAFDETAVPNATFRTPRIPGNDRRWITFGVSHHPSKQFQLDVAYAHLFISDTNINNVDIVTGHSLTGSYEHEVNIFSAGVTWKFP